MAKFRNLMLLVTFCIYQFLTISGSNEPVCRGDEGKKHRISLSINSTRNDNDEWTTKFSASKNMSVRPKSIVVDLNNSVVECGENFFFNVQGIIKDNSEGDKRKGLFFHYKCSSNAAVTNDGRTLQKIKLEEKASAITTRPLRDNEVFTVRIDKLSNKFKWGIGIGVTTYAPETFDIPNHMASLKTGSWIFYNAELYFNLTYVHYGYDVNGLKVGQRVGVMRSKSGTLHLFVDGHDQGPALSNIPDQVYGAVDLNYNAMKATIVDAL